LGAVNESTADVVATIGASLRTTAEGALAPARSSVKLKLHKLHNRQLTGSSGSVLSLHAVDDLLVLGDGAKGSGRAGNGAGVEVGGGRELLSVEVGSV
jgi:hypothetical protein